MSTYLQQVLLELKLQALIYLSFIQMQLHYKQVILDQLKVLHLLLLQIKTFLKVNIVHNVQVL